MAHPWLTGVLSGALAGASFAGLSLFPLAWVALVGLWAGVLGQPRRRDAVKTAFAYGLTLSLLHHHWMLFVRMPAPVGYLVAAPLIGGFFALWAWVSRRVGRGHPVAAVLGYLFLEHVVNMGPFSFGWYTLGYTQWNNPLVLQGARLVGGHGLSLFILWVNLGLWRWLQAVARSGVGLRATPVPATLKRAVLATVVVSVLGLGSGFYRHHRSEKKWRAPKPVNVVMVQINVSGEVKESATPQENREIFHRHLKRTLGKNPGPGGLVVFPETFVSAYLEDDASYADLWAALKNFAVQHRLWVAFGMNDLVPVAGGLRDTNGFVLMNPRGEIVDRYHKRSLVPYGEFVPYRAVLEKLGLGDWVRENIIYQDNMPGQRATVFRGPGGLGFSAPICFETAFPWQYRQYARGGAQLILTPTNDAWYGKSFLAVQRLAQGVVRSVESGLPTAQSSNSGIGYLADPWGRVKWRTGVMEAAVLRFKLDLSGSMRPFPTLYNRLGGIWEFLVLIATPFSLLFLGKPWLKSKDEGAPHGTNGVV